MQQAAVRVDIIYIVEGNKQTWKLQIQMSVQTCGCRHDSSDELVHMHTMIGT